MKDLENQKAGEFYGLKTWVSKMGLQMNYVSQSQNYLI